jgi:dihydropteroate synthase
VIETLVADCNAIISVDTSNPIVMNAAANAGAALINDVRALTREGALMAAKASNLPVCLMHMQGEPQTMQINPHYADPVSDVCKFLMSRINACCDAGIASEQLLLDPGFGFGKTLAHNLELLRRLPELVALGYPVLVGLSRKSLLGTLLAREVDARLPGSLALALLAAQQGAAIIRVHDVAATADVLNVWAAMQQA